jgi:hypothetical protein
MNRLAYYRHLSAPTGENKMTEAEQIKQLREALKALVQLHQSWDKGTAYVPVSFMQKNNAAIKAAREALRNSEIA